MNDHEAPTTRFLAELAASCACYAYENNFTSRRGVYFIEEAGVLCLYNNNPYADFPTLRDDETAIFRERMKAEGLKELA